jgi:hypothetical protein
VISSGITKISEATDRRSVEVSAERSQKTQSFQWSVSAVWSTFSALVEIINVTTMRAPQDWRRSAWLITCGLFSPNDSAVFRVWLSSHDLACVLTRLMAVAAHAQLLRQCQFS